MEFAALGNFMTNCFHEDWVYEFGDDDRAISWYLEEAFPEQVEELRAEFDAFLALELSEDELEPVLRWDLGCSYDPAFEDGVKRADWLRSVRARLG